MMRDLMPDDFTEYVLLGLLSILTFIIVAPLFIITLPITIPLYFVGNFVAELMGFKYKPFKDEED